jgi:ABC-type polysaccharide/polyol phosphate transport system ATPase subunit
MTVIELHNVSKKYTLKFHKGALIRDILPRIINPYLKREFWALREINLNVDEGEVVGIIGDNGAGKSTLLSIVGKITAPTEGKVSFKGRVHPLLSLGAGFHRELSGEDNIYLNALLLGLKKEEIKERIGRIIEFSELGGFIKQPIYTYSSGMLLRLGFAIAVHVDFDILLLDEILAVGDLNFQRKCMDKIKEFIENGKTILIASQSMDTIKELCTRVILLDSGKILKDGEPEEVVDYYHRLRERKKMFGEGIISIQNIPEEIERISSGWGKKFGNGKAEITRVEFFGKDGKRENFMTGEPLTISVDAEIKEEIYNPHFGIAIFRDDYVYCHGPNTKFDGIKIKKLKPGRLNFQLHYPEFILNAGNYKVSVAIWDEEETDPFVYHCAYYDLEICSGSESQWLATLPFRIEKHAEPDVVDKSQAAFIEKFLILDGSLNEKEVFLTGEDLILDIWIKNKQNKKLKIDLFKFNGVFCHSIEMGLEPQTKYKTIIKYSKIPLLSGDYTFKLSLQKEGKESQDVMSKRFAIFSELRDHGTIYIPHIWEWDLNGN